MVKPIWLILLIPIALIAMLALANAPYWWIILTLIGVGAVLLYRHLDWVAFAIAGVMIGALVLVLAGAGAFNGWNWVPPLKGTIVEAATGKPVAGARVWMGSAWGFVGFFRGGPAGDFAAPGGGEKTAKTNDKGHFHMSPYLGPHPVIRLDFLAFAQGYRAKEVSAGASGRVLTGEWTGWSSAPVPGLEGTFHRRLLHSTIRLELQPLAVKDTAGWEAHLGTLQQHHRSKLLLDEASRYVSQGGKLTDNILLALDRWLPVGPPINGQTGDKRMQLLAKGILEFCLAHGNQSVFCSRRPHLVENYSKLLGLKAPERQP